MNLNKKLERGEERKNFLECFFTIESIAGVGFLTKYSKLMALTFEYSGRKARDEEIASEIHRRTTGNRYDVIVSDLLVR